MSPGTQSSELDGASNSLKNMYFRFRIHMALIFDLEYSFTHYPRTQSSKFDSASKHLEICIFDSESGIDFRSGVVSRITRIPNILVSVSQPHQSTCNSEYYHEAHVHERTGTRKNLESVHRNSDFRTNQEYVFSIPNLALIFDLE